jgi:hypothetical protein
LSGFVVDLVFTAVGFPPSSEPTLLTEATEDGIIVGTESNEWEGIAGGAVGVTT